MKAYISVIIKVGAIKVDDSISYYCAQGNK